MLQADLVGRVRLKLIVRDVFLSPTTGGHHSSCDLIWFVEKIGGDIFKADV